MSSPDYTPSAHLTPVKGAYSPDHAPSESITPIKSTSPLEHHYPTPPNTKPKPKAAPSNLRINTRITTPEEMWEKGPERTITKSEDSLSVQERRALDTYGIFIDEYNSRQQQGVDYVQIWTTHVESVVEPELIVAMNPFYDEYDDGDYYTWLNDTYYEGHMPEIVRRANAFRGFPQLDEELYNPQDWEQKQAYYRGPKGIRDMEPYLAYIEREQGLLDPELSEYDRLAAEEAQRENIEAFQKTWANTLGRVDEPTSTTLWASSAAAATAGPEKLPTDSNTFSSKTPASPAVETEPTNVSLATRCVFTTFKAEGSHIIRIKCASVAERAAGLTAGSSHNAAKKKNQRRRRQRKDGAYEPGRDFSEDESDNDMPRKRSKKSRR